jgi:hypothetical protein
MRLSTEEQYTLHDIEAEDNPSSDGTCTDTSSDDEEWDEETTVLEMLSSPYSKRFLLYTGRFAHLGVCSEYSEEQILHSLSHMFADASQAMRKEVILDPRPVLSRTRNVRPAPGRPFIAVLL